MDASVNNEKNLRIGLLHSLSGTMSLSEQPLLDAEKMAIREINEGGGILGCKIEPIIADGASLPEKFAKEAQKLLDAGAISLFGCWTSASRKAVRPIVEAADSLLWYPVQYEGLEESKFICYTGSCLNQQIIPALEWAVKEFGNRIFLIGSDYVFPRTANQLIYSLVEEMGGSIVSENYIALGNQNFDKVIELIIQTKPSVVFSTLNGDSNIGFYQQYRDAGILPSQIPIIATSVTETEFDSIAEIAAGHYACWSYFQSIETIENQKFVSRFKKMYGENRVISDPTMMAYSQLYLWKMAVERAGTFEPKVVRQNLIGSSLESPMGEIKIETNLHLIKPVRIGKLKSDGQFEIIWSHKPIAPLPWLGVEKLKFPGKLMVKQGLAALSDNIERAEKKRVTEMMQFQNTVIELSRLGTKMSLQQKFNRIMEMAAKAINVERVSVWFFDENKRSILANNIFLLSSGEHISGSDFSSNDYPNYFKALKNDPLIDAHDAIHDPRTSEFAEGYLKPKGISSMMDVAIRFGDEVIGIICYEHVGSKRIWSYEEQVFGSSIAGIVSIAIENDKRQKAEEKIRQSEGKYRFIAETVPAIFWTAESDGSFDYFNSRTYDYVGKKFEDLKGKGWAQFIHPDDLNNTLAVWNECLTTGKSLQVESRLLRKDGEYLWYLTRSNPLKDKDGKVIKWFGYAIDINEQKEFAETLKLKNEELITINKDLDNFIYTASHDLKVPVTNIEGLIEILRSETSDEKPLMDILSMMSSSVEKFKDTVDILTEITKVQRIREEDVEDIDVSKIIDGVTLELKDKIKESEAQIKIDIDECPIIKFSRKNFVKILENLISNSIKFRSRERRLEIIIETREIQDYYVLSVTDNGLGIRKSSVKKVFELFKKAHDHGQGRGVGLYIIKRLIENAGGKIELETEEGKGSTFKVYFKK